MSILFTFSFTPCTFASRGKYGRSMPDLPHTTRLLDFTNITPTANGVLLAGIGGVCEVRSSAIIDSKQHPVSTLVTAMVMDGIIKYVPMNAKKGDVKTSHLFVILLTAKAGEESELEGYTSGADVYITKLFSMEILRNRISHLLEMQNDRYKIFLSSVEVKAEKLTNSDIDKKFACGFSSPNYFSRCFKDMSGVSPKKYAE